MKNKLFSFLVAGLVFVSVACSSNAQRFEPLPPAPPEPPLEQSCDINFLIRITQFKCCATACNDHKSPVATYHNCAVDMTEKYKCNYSQTSVVLFGVNGCSCR